MHRLTKILQQKIGKIEGGKKRHHVKAQSISNWFLDHDNEFTVLKWLPQSPDPNPIEHLCNVVERDSMCFLGLIGRDGLNSVITGSSAGHTNLQFRLSWGII